MKNLAFFFMVILAAANLSIAQARSSKPDKFYLSGLTNLKKANTAETEELREKFCNSAYQNFSQSIKINPTFAEAYFRRATAIFNEYGGTCSRVIDVADLDAAIRLKPDYVEAYLLRAETWWDSDDYENQLADLSRAIELKPAGAPLLLHRGKVYLKHYEFNKALADGVKALQKLLSGKTKSRAKISSVYIFLGDVYNTGLYLEKAIEAYTTALKFDSKNGEIYQRRGGVYEYIGETEKASDDFYQADLLNRRRRQFFMIGDKISDGKNSAIEYPEVFQIIRFREVGGLVEELPTIKTIRNAKRPEKTAGQRLASQLLKFNRLISFNPRSDLALWKRGDFYLRQIQSGNHFFWASAEIDFTNAFAINPRYEYLVNRGVGRAGRDNKTNYEFAVKLFSDAIQINRQSVEAFYNRGLSYLKLNENEKAIADFTEVIKLDPKFITAYKSRARAFRAVGKTAEAEADEKMVKMPN